ncbi:ABC transporter permease [Caulobacter sp. D4A]|uniref:ABC transporter permease n=1 Tax=unclassified Caulobacter TaxID=2648921 RepID=UPI000D739BC9|nr:MULTISPECIES: ABC transporter permease [unclassified Caulobacter]PXA83788.1 ABC transporter permease [Caulobacter sp. D4A]PXA92481.1 ABC transporter permease [Caulobacter sp. D5]
MSLALATLLYEWRRYMAAVVALAFSGLLVLAQVGMFVGIGKGFTAQIDRARADIMVLGPGAKALFGGPSGLPRRMIPLVYSHPEVIQVAPLDGSGGRFQNILSPEETAKAEARAKRGEKGGNGRKTEFVNVTVIDAIPGYVTVPTDYTSSMIEALRRPYAVAVDQTALKRLGVKKGDKALYNGKTITIGVVTTGYPNIIQPTLVMSRDTLRMLGEADTGQRVGPLMVQIRDPAHAEVVAAQLNKKADGKFRAWTRQELADANSGAMLEDQIIGIMLGFSAFLGLLIGVAITWQTLRGAIMANIKEFASLRALGVSMGDLRNIVMELSFWVGIVGVFAAGLLTWLVSLLAVAGGVPMYFPPVLVAIVAVFLVVIAMLSGFLSLGVLKNSQPADLLR